MRPIFLIGAARSGTKLLRDMLGRHPELDAIPYDINYLWRLGHEDLKHDELPDITDRARKAINRHLQQAGADFVVEKTVSNCFRVAPVARAFPEARFIFLVRDGYDVTESAVRQWGHLLTGFTRRVKRFSFHGSGRRAMHFDIFVLLLRDRLLECRILGGRSMMAFMLTSKNSTLSRFVLGSGPKASMQPVGTSFLWASDQWLCDTKSLCSSLHSSWACFSKQWVFQVRRTLKLGL